MKVTYQNNVKRLKKALLDRKSKLGTLNVLEHPFENVEIPQDHTRFSLSPWDGQYSSPLFHVNLYQVVDPRQLDKAPFVLVRDGLYTLLDFFHRFPDPGKVKKLLLVHQNFKNFIPKKWINNILFFDFEVFNEYFAGKKYNNSLLVKGSIMEGAWDMDEFFKLIDKASKQKTINKLILSTLPRQNWFMDRDWRVDAIFCQISNTFLKRIHQDLDPQLNVELIEWKNFFSIQDIHQYEFLDFNQKSSFYTDDYTDFFLFKKGAKPLFMKPRKNKNPEDLLIPLTHYHGVRVFSVVDGIDESHFESLAETFSALGIKKGEKLNTSAFQAVADLTKNLKLKTEEKYWY